MPGLTRDGDVHVLDLGDGQNQIDPGWIDAVSRALDEVEAAPPPRALVTTATGKFFSMGLNLQWMAANPDGVPELVRSMHELIARTLELPAPTVAALNGHTMAGGALFALAHDYRVMRADRGYLALPEIDGRIAISPGLIELVRSRVAPQTALALLTGGRRYTGEEAERERIVDALAPQADLLARAKKMAGALSGKDTETYGAMKSRLHAGALAALRDSEANHADLARFEWAMRAMGITA